jgi:hypothetical protein
VPHRIAMPPVGGGPKVVLHGNSANRGGSPAAFEACAFATVPLASAAPAIRANAALMFSLPHDIFHLGCMIAARRRRLVCQRPLRATMRNVGCDVHSPALADEPTFVRRPGGPLVQCE